ncbi:MAG: hypothetical protein IPL16_15425 [Ignavibacteria bacterium]|nr:hypothetical protein [Ignavibacteria bacterium]
MELLPQTRISDDYGFSKLSLDRKLKSFAGDAGAPPFYICERKFIQNLNAT